MSGGSSGGGGTSTTIQKNEPWDAAKPYYEQLYKTAWDKYNQVDTSPYTGQLVATPSDTTTKAQNDMMAAVPGLTAAGQAALTSATDTANGKYMDFSNNAYLKDAIGVANDNLYQNFNRNVLPSITSSAIANGAYGGSRNGVALANATNDLTKNMSDTGAKIAYQNYATERQNQVNSPSSIATAMQEATQGATVESQVGAQLDAQQQALLNAELSRYNANALSSMRGLDTLSNIMGAGGYSNGAGTVTSMPSNGSTATNVLTGALGGGALGYGLGSMTGLTALGLGTGGVGLIGAGLGALAGGLF